VGFVYKMLDETAIHPLQKLGQINLSQNATFLFRLFENAQQYVGNFTRIDFRAFLLLSYVRLAIL